MNFLHRIERLLGAVLAAFLWSHAVAVPSTFEGTGVGLITDGNSFTPRIVSFAVNSMGAPLTDVRVTMTFSPRHPFSGDLSAILKAPNGTSVTLFGRIGSVTLHTFGSAYDVAGAYTFVDPSLGAANIWSAVGTGEGTIPPGTYSTTISGPVAASPAATTPLISPFAGLSVAEVNGTWTLELRDHAVGDTGGISQASLTLDSAAAPPTVFTVAPSAIDFGTTRLGDVAFRPLRIAASSANLVNVDFPSAACSITGTDASMFVRMFNALSLSPGSAETVGVAFRPTSNGTKSATLHCVGMLPNNVDPADVSIALTGTAGVPPPPANCFDVDGDGVMNPLVDGLFITRLQLGFSLSAAANGIAFNPPRSTPLKVAAFLISTCGYPLTQ